MLKRPKGRQNSTIGGGGRGVMYRSCWPWEERAVTKRTRAGSMKISRCVSGLCFSPFAVMFSLLAVTFIPKVPHIQCFRVLFTRI